MQRQIFYLLINQNFCLSRIIIWIMNTSSTTINNIINLCPCVFLFTGQIKWNDLYLCVHMCTCLCVNLCRRSQTSNSISTRFLSHSDQVVEMMINWFYSHAHSCSTKAMNFECDKRWNSFAATIRSCLPELSLAPLLCAGTCSLSLLSQLYKYAFWRLEVLFVCPIFTK